MARLNKRVAIARSGVYVYSAGAVPGLGLSVPPEKKNQRSFGVFRPPEVLERAKDKFTKLPVTLEHPPRLIDGNNFREFTQGYTGDTATIEPMADGHNVRVCSTLTLADNESISAYYRGVVEVSPGYIGVFHWEDGMSPDGEHYDIVMEDIKEVNHLALTRKGRGGPSACVLDSREVLVVKRKSGLFYAIHKRLTGVQDSTDDSFTATLADLMARNRKMTDDEVGQSVGKLSLQVDYLPDSADKDVLSGYVSDLIGIREEPDECAKQAAIMIGNLYARLDQQTMASVVADAYDESTEEEKKEPKPETDEEGDKKEPESGESEEHEAKETPKEEEAEHAESDTALDAPVAGPDDGIYDKKWGELTEQERDFLWSELMCMAKSHAVTESEAETKPAPTADPVEEEPSEAEKEHDAEEAPDATKDEGEAKDEADKGEEDKKAVTDSALDAQNEPRYPDSAHVEAGKSTKHAAFGLSLTDMISDMKSRGGR